MIQASNATPRQVYEIDSRLQFHDTTTIGGNATRQYYWANHQDLVEHLVQGGCSAIIHERVVPDELKANVRTNDLGEVFNPEVLFEYPIVNTYRPCPRPSVDEFGRYQFDRMDQLIPFCPNHYGQKPTRTESADYHPPYSTPRLTKFSTLPEYPDTPDWVGQDILLELALNDLRPFLAQARVEQTKKMYPYLPNRRDV